MRFRAVVQRNGKTATGIEVPPEVVAELASGKKPAVRVSLNGYAYPSTVATRDGRFMVPVSAAVREEAGVQAGDAVEVAIELDTVPREVVVPADFRAALGRDAEAERVFEASSYSTKRRIVIPIDEAKTDDTRQRRITRAVERLRAGKA